MGKRRGDRRKERRKEEKEGGSRQPKAAVDKRDRSLPS